VPGINKDKANVKSLVKAYLSQEIAGRWLLIVDNADDLEMLYKRVNESDVSSGSLALADYLPFSRKGSILFTTRNYEAAVNQAGINVVTVEEMTESDSQRLLETCLIRKGLLAEIDAARKLLDLLTYLPLAIKQATAFINQKQMSILDYLGIYESDDQELVELLSADFEDQGRYRNIKNPIASTWLISFRQIQQYDLLAAEYFYIMSCVAQRNIPDSLLPSASNLREAQAIGTLKAYTFITVRKGGKSYDIHRLVQIAVRNWLKTTGELTRWGCETMKQVARIFPFFEHKNRYECAMYLPHVQCILKFQDFPEDFQEPLRKLLFNIGEYFQKTGKYIKAEKMCRQTLELKKEALGDDHPSTLDSMNKLAIVLRLRGNYVEAEMLQQQTLGLKKELLGEDHPSTLDSTSDVAIMLRVRGKYIEAEALQRQTFQLRKEVLGDAHPDTLFSMNSLAQVFRYQGKHAEAKTLQQQTLELRKEVLGNDHPDTLVSMNNLAALLLQQGKHAEAETLQRQTMGIKKEVLGDEHPSTLKSMCNLAEVFRCQGKHAEAKALQQQTLELRKEVLGNDHPDTLDSMNNLAEVFRYQGNYAEAETLQRQTLELRKGVLGNDHPDTLNSMNNLAIVLEQQGKHAIGEESTTDTS
jgi:tetratricopeptide (TPR) repeat protein